MIISGKIALLTSVKFEKGMKLFEKTLKIKQAVPSPE